MAVRVNRWEHYRLAFSRNLHWWYVGEPIFPSIELHVVDGEGVDVTNDLVGETTVQISLADDYMEVIEKNSKGEPALVGQVKKTIVNNRVSFHDLTISMETPTDVDGFILVVVASGAISQVAFSSHSFKSILKTPTTKVVICPWCGRSVDTAESATLSICHICAEKLRDSIVYERSGTFPQVKNKPQLLTRAAFDPSATLFSAPLQVRSTAGAQQPEKVAGVSCIWYSQTTSSAKCGAKKPRNRFLPFSVFFSSHLREKQSTLRPDGEQELQEISDKQSAYARGQNTGQANHPTRAQTTAWDHFPPPVPSQQISSRKRPTQNETRPKSNQTIDFEAVRKLLHEGVPSLKSVSMLNLQPTQSNLTSQPPLASLSQVAPLSNRPERTLLPSLTSLTSQPPPLPKLASTTPSLPNYSSQLPPKPNFTSQQPPQPIFSPQQPPQPNFSPQQPPQRNFTPQQPPQPNFTPQQPLHSSFTSQPLHSNLTAQPPLRSRFTAQLPLQPNPSAQPTPQSNFTAHLPPHSNLTAQLPPHSNLTAKLPPNSNLTAQLPPQPNPSAQPPPLHPNRSSQPPPPHAKATPRQQAQLAHTPKPRKKDVEQQSSKNKEEILYEQWTVPMFTRGCYQLNATPMGRLSRPETDLLQEIDRITTERQMP